MDHLLIPINIRGGLNGVSEISGNPSLFTQIFSMHGLLSDQNWVSPRPSYKFDPSPLFSPFTLKYAWSMYPLKVNIFNYNISLIWMTPLNQVLWMFVLNSIRDNSNHGNVNTSNCMLIKEGPCRITETSLTQCRSLYLAWKETSKPIVLSWKEDPSSHNGRNSLTSDARPVT